MMPSAVNHDTYLRTSRNFPMEAQALSVEVNRSYVDIANAVNTKIIGIFPVNRSAVTGESWYLNGPVQRQQTLRQVYTFTAAGNIPHGLNLAQLANFTRIYGTIFDGSVYYPLPYVDATAANNQISVKVTGTNIVITAGAGSPPSITSGLVVLEWLSNV
jgi:hypothetical protein